MKLRNKKTGEMGDLIIDKAFLVVRTGAAWEHYSSLTELNSEWEDAPEEPKEYWYIDIDGEIMSGNVEDDTVKVMREIGNYFETPEEAEKAVEKLKTWKRLKDKGFRFTGEGRISNCISYEFDCDYCLIAEDCRLLFGGEE